MKNANVALLQLCSGENIRDNLAQIEQQIKLLNSGIQLVMTPENALLFANAASYRHHAEQHNNGPLQDAVREMARKYGVWIQIGSMPMISRESPERITTSSLLFDDQGELKARYDKIHMFDVDIQDVHGRYRESDTYQPGEHLTVVDTPVGRLGMTVCYDLRFPGLFQALRAQGAEIISVPAAFTKVTGEAHWEILLRARAIENQCVILAAAQVGRHGATRRTWGHTMAVDAWGKIIGQNPDAVSALKVKIETTGLKTIRNQMPVLQHNRFASSLVPRLSDSKQSSK
ncbi:deaminated glutathione amidase [Yersinia enterocolitica]|uniref:Carbon-nitrogen hydrolase n=1 Tax=Yersinia enterocolitica serotype O:8 / biotype 1B (strain NCTC 13174 / 8081) TaxID=393305 RepID=A1JRI6_YERE8|nr:deaminated glutathione amidase [Yersinia enterocolitica]AJJ21807.1 carbon-nitrogen hydrolase family protein [Yersinia enterocolitica]CAL13823.1 putative carbon-nitrogen hydrolase [Yersinia enterocolitica subsp. enterocolitica 8081]CNF44322.1 putative carbon-nitrogen hydrolase [Yersinia enterocolitica]CRX99264.1 putative carbon-nitrogen hydrolase [Yersinia enterocolitica]CRY25834.1 putative carbon-nitrogen hydrolase [Yersinia enterocolitica]